jgi:hypothetical protein
MHTTALFVDDDEVAQRPGTFRTLHPPERRAEPVIRWERPWEGPRMGFSTVFQVCTEVACNHIHVCSPRWYM